MVYNLYKLNFMGGLPYRAPWREVSFVAVWQELLELISLYELINCNALNALQSLFMDDGNAFPAGIIDNGFFINCITTMTCSLGTVEYFLLKPTTAANAPVVR